jgi:tripartite-type tricarboxylate transporter receptor subunit TctC
MLKHTRRKHLALLGAALATPALPRFAGAQAWPSKPLRAIIPFTAGSTIDLVSRIVFEPLSQQLGQSIIVENRGGAGGTIGAALVARSDPDGYTLLANSSAHAANPGIYKDMRYDTMRDFVNLALLGGGPNVLIVSPESGWKSLKDFIDAAKKNPGKLNFSSAGVGSGTHFNLEKLKLATGIDVVHVPYKGTPEAIGDTIANRVCCYWAPLNAALPHVNGGKAVALAVSSAQRSPLLQNVPSVAEQGYAGFDYTLWVGLWGPAKMPADLAAKINKDVNAALASPDLRERPTKLGTVPGNLTIPQFTDFVKKEVEDTKKILEAAGIKPQ